MPYLSYQNIQGNGHFEGHSIVVFGFDTNEKCFLVSDRDSSDILLTTPKGKIGADYYKVPFDE